jgi:RNA recognition motif-containing protein
LPFHCQWQELKDLFRTAGQIVRADVALSPDGRSRGFGTVLFANEVDAAAAVAMFNGLAADVESFYIRDSSLTTWITGMSTMGEA